MKTNKFKALIAHTLSTGILFAPTVAILLSNASNSSDVPIQDLVFAFLATFQTITLLFKLGMNKHFDDAPIVKYYYAHAWKSLLDNPSISATKKKQDVVMVKVRTGVVDDEVLSTYADYKFNSDKVNAWRDKIYYHKTPRNFPGEPENSKWSKAIGFRFEEIVESVESAVSPEVLQSLIKENIAESLSLKNFDAENIQYILKNTGYNKLKEIDYADFEQIVKEKKSNVEDIVELLAENAGAVDWSRIKNTLVHHYRGASYNSIANIIASIVPDVGAQISGSTPNFPAFRKWALIQEHYEYVSLNKEILDGASFSQYEKEVSATAELLLRVTKTLKGMSATSVESTKKLIEENLSELLGKSIAMRADLETCVIKELSINRNHLRHKA